MKTRALLLAVASLIGLVSGCQNPGIVQLSPGTYMLMRVDRAGVFGNTAALKAGVIKEANEFAEKQGQVAIPIASHETPNYPTHCATFEYQFRVVDSNDPEARRAAFLPRADVSTKDESAKQPDLYAELTKLAELRKQGLITDAEFEAEKTKLLNRPK